ncbi:MAG: glycosyltransferase [Synergistaceae bacterium]|nr:glycosyltransferase [Synergistaceae bacterium]
MNDKIRVLQVNKFYHPVTGGVERVVQQIAEGLNGNVDMTVLACQKKGLGINEKINDVRVIKSGSLGTYFSMPVSFSFLRTFSRLSRDADIVHIHMPFPLADVAMFLSGYKGKVVLWWHSDVVKQKKLLLLYRPFLEWLLNRADLIVAATQGHIDNSAFISNRKDKCVVIPYGVDKNIIELSSPSRSAKLKENSDPCSILYIGRLVYYKGCDVLLEAFSKVRNARLTIVGEGPLRSSLEKQADKLGISEKVDFISFLDDRCLAEKLAECDFLVLPSVERSEAFGLVQIEAMAFGKPVINTDLPSGAPLVSLDGITGLTVPPNDAEALAIAIQRIIDEPDLRERFGKAAYKRAREEFSMDKMLSSLFTEYKKLIPLPSFPHDFERETSGLKS